MLCYLAAAPFDAARMLPALPPAHAQQRLHGHGFQARVRGRPDGLATRDGAAEALRERLAACVAPLDGGLLNARVDPPTDLYLCRWIRARLASPSIDRVGLRSRPDRGVDLTGGGALSWRRFRFEAAHRLPNVPPGHKCARTHGHGYGVRLTAAVDGALDHDRLAEAWAPLHARLHMASLNDLPGLENPTSERLAGWVWERLQPEVPGLARVSVTETPTSGCHYDGRGHRIWKDIYFEAALRLAEVPPGSPASRLHGHGYRLRLHLGAPLDPVLGWTVDYAEVKRRFEPVFDRLDHRRLDELDGIAGAGLGDLLAWVRAHCEIPGLDGLELYETPERGALLSWTPAP